MNWKQSHRCGLRQCDRSSWYKYIVELLRAIEREHLKALMSERGVGMAGGVYEIPLHRQPVFAGQFDREAFPIADDFRARHICLPVYYGMEEEGARYGVRTLNGHRCSTERRRNGNGCAMSIVVTGGAGFVGVHVLEELRRRGLGRVIALDSCRATSPAHLCKVQEPAELRRAWIYWRMISSFCSRVSGPEPRFIWRECIRRHTASVIDRTHSRFNGGASDRRDDFRQRCSARNLQYLRGARVRTARSASVGADRGSACGSAAAHHTSTIDDISQNSDC